SELAKFAAAIGHPEPQNALADTLARPDWAQDTRLIDALRAPLEKICARYLLREKSGGHPVDSVAQFHLTNGARVNRVYWLAGTSARGLRQSYGLLVSYPYDLREGDKNHERFLSHRTIAPAAPVQGLLDYPRRRPPFRPTEGWPPGGAGPVQLGAVPASCRAPACISREG